jgi:Ca-activated chloride channel family protein
VEATAIGSGEAVQEILSGHVRPTVFSPASGAYITLLDQAWMSTEGPGHTRAIAPAGEPLVLSPIVIAMWRPMAEALGWPGKRLGWADLLKVAADPQGWGRHKHSEWGRFKLGHTHPEFSNSGLLAVLAEAYAGAHTTRGLTAASLDDAAVQKFVGAVEQTIVHYGKSTGFFADKMLERGPSYMSAAVLYENLVIESYAHPGAAPLVAIYPSEGTFWSDHPYAILDAEWVDADQREAAEALLAFLKGKPAQQRALSLGFRPADASIAMASPIDAEHGVDPQQPTTLLEVPDGPTLAKLLDVWRKVKKTADVILVFDKSGSMRGKPLAEAVTATKLFLATLHDSDEISLLFFDGVLHDMIGPLPLGKSRDDLNQRLALVQAGGGTLLYDAIASAYDLAAKRAVKEPGRTHAVVVMTDGKDEGSRLKLEALERKISDAGDGVKVFTIGYGPEADAHILGAIAEAAKGATANGDVQTIQQIFEDVGSFF